ncbi:MAG: sodium:solute symporter family protein [Desulfobacterales bacterium]|nr:sodium:solute symporter family protein [Desulfobacterales bacterium]
MIVAGSLIGLTAFLLVVLIVGFLAYKKGIRSNVTDYFLASRGLGVVALVGTLFATWFSTFAFLGGPGLFYKLGTGWLLFGLFNSLGPLLIWVFGRRIWLLGKKYNFITPADLLDSYYEHRGIRLLTAIICVIILFPYATIQLSGVAKAITGFTAGALPYWFGVLFILFSVALIAYFGGARGIAWMDALQGFFFGILLIISAFFVIRWAGGWFEGWSAAIKINPEMFIFKAGASGKYYTLALMWTLGWVLVPHLWQRMYMAASPVIMGKSMLIASIASLWVITFTGLIIGFVAKGLVPSLPPGTDADMILPILYSTFFPIGGIFLVIAAYAAGMSTLNSQLLSASSVVTQDIYKAVIHPEAPEAKQAKIGRMFVGVFVAALLIFALIPAGQALLIPLASVGVSYCVLLLAPLVGVVYWKGATRQGAFWSMLLGFIILVLTQFTPLGGMMPGTIGPAYWGFIVSIVTFVVVSRFTQPMSEKKIEMFHGFLTKAINLSNG